MTHFSLLKEENQQYELCISPTGLAVEFDVVSFHKIIIKLQTVTVELFSTGSIGKKEQEEGGKFLIFLIILIKGPQYTS